MAIPIDGFCIHITRTREERRPAKSYARTVGQYQCYWNGVAMADLTGQLVERGGPGDNTTAVGNDRDLRIAAGTYPLAFHIGSRYRTSGYTANLGTAATPRPGILLRKTGERSAILIHPGSDYIWSVGCLNPASLLVDAMSKIDFVDSRARVIAIIDGMKQKLGERFPNSAGTPIPLAVALIEGEPSARSGPTEATAWKHGKSPRFAREVGR